MSINIKIIGSGPTGAILAISLAKIGCNITLFDLRNKIQIINSKRAYALTHSSRNLLEKLDLWNNIINLSGHSRCW